MKQFKHLLVLFFYFVGLMQLQAQLVEGTPCTATCLDPNKTTITGRQPNQNGSSPNLNLPCGSGTSEDNPAWWILRPSGTTLTFSVTTSNCVAGGCGLGVQMTLWEGDACGSVTAIDCIVGTSGSFTSSVQPCKVYYLQVDGLCECQCNVIVTYDKNQILKEVPKPEIKGPKQICKGAMAKFCASLPSLQGCRPDSYNWTLNPASAGTITKIPGDPDCVNVKITNPPANGKVTICAEPKFNGKCPPKTNKECFEFEVIELKPATCNVDLCPEERPVIYELIKCIKRTNPTFNGTIKPETYVINLPPGTKKTVTIPYVVEGSGCASEVKLDIHVFDNKPVQLPPLILCEGEKQIVKGIEFACADAGSAPKKFVQEGTPKPIRCDTSFEMLVQCIKITPKISGKGTLDCSTTSLTLNAAGAGTLTLPNNIKITTYEGKGTREFAWSKDGTPIAGATNPTLVVTAPGLYEVTLSYTYEVIQTINGKQGSWKKTCFKTAQVQIDGIPGSAVAETPSTLGDPCANGTATYFIIPDPNATGYQWSVVGGGATIVGSSTNPANLVVKNTGLPYQVCLVKTACNKTSAPVCITVTPILAPVKPILRGENPVCQGDSTCYFIDNESVYGAAVDYTWAITNGTATYNADSSEVCVKWSKTATSGSVIVTVTDRCGSSKDTINVAINSLPVKPNEISGKKVVCLEEKNSYTVTAALFATNYKWYLSGGGTMTPDTGKTVNITWNTVGKYQLCVKSLNNCLPEGSDTFCIDIDVRPIPSPNAGTDRKVCAKNTILKAVLPSGNTGKWTLATPAPGTAVFTSPTDTICPVTVSVCGLYKFVWTESNGICSATDTVAIRFSEPPTVKSLTYVCNNGVSPKTYDVTLVMEGCDGPFAAPTSKYPVTVDASGKTFFIPNIPQTDTSWSIIVSNAYNCNTTVAVKADCNCDTRSGTMKLEPIITACAEPGSKIKATHNGNEVNDGNDVFAFVLHEGTGGSVIFPVAENKTGEFSFDPALDMQCGKTYYISYVIGNDKNGSPDPADKCIQTTPQGQPVRWDCKPEPNAGPNKEVCGLTATLDATLSLPAPSTGQWSGDFATIDDISKPDAKVTVATAGPKTFTWTETNGKCKASDDVIVTFIKSELKTSDLKYVCNSTNDFYDYTFTAGGGVAPYSVLNPTTGAVLATLSSAPYTYTATNIPSGDPVTFKITDAKGCDTITVTDSHLCGCTTALGTLTIADKEVCQDKNIVASATGAVKDGNDVEEFILADGCDLATATVLARNSTGTFSFDDVKMDCDVTYKLIYIIGNNTGSGQVSLTDNCRKQKCEDVKFICNPAPTATVVSVDTCLLTATLTASPGTNGSWSASPAGIITFTSTTSPNVVASNLSYGITTFVWTEVNNGCSATASVPVTINKKGDLSFTVDTLCSSNAKTYQLQFTLTGSAPFNLDPSSTTTGSFAGNVFTTSPVNSGTKIKACFTDALVCSPVCGEFEPICPCLTNAGQMSQNLASACVDGTITVSVPPASSGLFLDSDDTAEFFLHTTNGLNDKLGLVLAQNTTGEFTFNAATMTAGTTYYVSYVVGDKSATDPSKVDLNARCTRISLGQPIVFNALPTAIIKDNSTICKGSNATISLDFTGKAPYEVIFTANGTAQTPLTPTQIAFNHIVNPNATTTYAFTKVTDGNGCVTNLTKERIVTVSEPGSAGLPRPDRRMCLGTDVEIDLEAELNNETPGGTWTVAPISLINNNVVSTKNLAVATYTYTYTVNGPAPCPVEKATFKITIDPIPVADAGPNLDLNCDASEVTLGIGNSSQGASAVYSWLTLSGEPLANTTILKTTTRKPGVYLLEVRDNVTNCFARDSVVVTNNVVDIDSFSHVMKEPSCFGEDNGSISITSIAGGTPNFTYSINNGPFSPYKNFLNLKAGIYSFTIKDKKGCIFTDSVSVTEPEEIGVTIVNLGTDLELDLGEEETLIAQVSSIDSAMLKRVVWTPACDSCLQTVPKNKSLVYKVKPNETTLYTVKVTNQSGCTAEDNILLRVNKPRRVYIPNIFYPDSDEDSGENRKLKVYLGIDVLKVHFFRVYDRWGNAVYEQADFTRRDVANEDKGWDGKFRGQPSSAGVYTYACMVEFIDGYKEVYKGDVLIVDKKQ